MKKIFTLFLAASLTSAAFAQEATTTFVVDNVEYIVTGETTVGLSGLTNEFTATELSVPSEVENEGKTYSVTSVEEDAIYWSDLTKLVLPEGVTELKETAIYSNDYLEEIVLPESLTTLSRSCFGYNDNPQRYPLVSCSPHPTVSSFSGTSNPRHLVRTLL